MKTLLAFLFLTPLAWAGPSSSGGGMVVTCFDQDDQIISTELLDVFEAKSYSGHHLIQSSGNFENDYYRIVKNGYELQGATNVRQFRDQILKNLRKFINKVDWVLPGTLPFLGDQGKTVVPIPSHCKLEQLAIFFDNDESVKIDEAIWERLDSLNRAALVEHELWYMHERNFRENTSESTRAYVAQRLTLSGFEKALSNVDEAHLFCRGTSRPSTFWAEHDYTHFYLFRTKNSRGGQDLSLHFTYLAGRALMIKTKVELPNFPFDYKSEWNSDYTNQALYPNGSGQNKEIVVPVKTKHRANWKLKISYKYGKPITLQLIQSGEAMPKITLRSCQQP